MIEYILAILLICIMPARAMYKSMRGKHDGSSRFRTYIQSSAIIVGLLVLLCYAWLHAARTLGQLGLDIPLSERGMVGLAIAAFLLVALTVVRAIAKRKRQEPNDVKAKERLAKSELLPRTSPELALFLAFVTLAGCGWELLYRGFLIWFLAPHIGMIGAVCLAALAYGMAHGYKNRAQFIASLASAFAFTIGFVLTSSLWWLMLLHTAAGVAGGFHSYRLASKGSTALSPNGVEAVSP